MTVLFALLSVSLGPLLSAQDADVAPRPNVVVILADDLGWADVGANNQGCFYDTPNIDRLAESGVRFTDGYAANPVCSPTRWSVVTGNYPSRADATNWFSGRRAGRFRGAEFTDRIGTEQTTIAEVLRAAGYATFFAGKWHLGPEPEHWPENHGFDVNRGGWKRGGPYGGKKYFSPYGNPRLEDGPDGEHLPARLAEETASFIAAQGEAPFFAMLAFYSVHTPLMAPADLVEKYRAKAEAIEGDEFASEEQVWPNGKPRRVRVLQKHAVYAGMVEAMDRAVGRVLAAIDDAGVRERTLVIFTSDNGGLSTSEGSPTSNLPLRGGKGWVYEGGIREPFIVRWPAARSGATSAVPVASIDIFPTVLEVCGVEGPDVDGLSLVPVLRDADTVLERPLFWHYPHYANQGGFPGGAVREGRYKLVERYEDGRVHLFDLEADIGERRDLAVAHPQRVEELRAKLHDWYGQVDAKFLRPLDAGAAEPWRPGT